jgi:hypothetical protein
VSSRDRLVLKVCVFVMRFATDRTRARVTVALLRAQHRAVLPDLLRRADFHPPDRTP